MKLSRAIARRMSVGWLLLLAGLTASVASAAEARSHNPIGRVARLMNPTLVELEDRIDWLHQRLRELSVYSPKPLAERYGWRACKVNGGPPPTLTLDLGDVYPLDDIFLIAAQAQSGEGNALFPLRLRVEASIEPGFLESRLVYETRDKIHEDQSGYPLRIQTRDVDARYVRLTFLLGHQLADRSVAALSEMIVVSGGEPVSFSARATATGCIDSPDRWHADYAIDGRSPLGIWEGGSWDESRGQILTAPTKDSLTEWIVDLKGPANVDRVVLFPVQMQELGGIYVLPDDLDIYLTDDPLAPAPENVIRERGGDIFTPLTINTGRRQARYVVIRAHRALEVGQKSCLPIAEIEVWSRGRNLALGEGTILTRINGSAPEPCCPRLTDGFANGLQILPVGHWLRQLTERREIEREIKHLDPIRNNMATESELNTTWGASIAIGLSLLVPIAFFERRRLVSRKHVDSLRKRIASDLHDDIGSNLGSISLIARSARKTLQRKKSPEDLAEDLDEMELIARESSLAMRDIVWLLERRQDTIGDFVKRMNDTCERLLRDIDYKLTCSSNRTAARMTLDAKRHLFLYFKEALHNILKHSKATAVTIKISDLRDRLVMEIVDNGVGLPKGEDGRPSTGRKLAARAKVLEGCLIVDSKPNRGTSLRLEVKRAYLTANQARV